MQATPGSRTCLDSEVIAPSRLTQRVLQARRVGDRVLVIFDYMEFPNGPPAQNLVAYDLHQNENAARSYLRPGLSAWPFGLSTQDRVSQPAPAAARLKACGAQGGALELGLAIASR